MYIDVVFSPYEFTSRGDITNKSVIVIDVLRATSTIAYALWGYRENDVDEILGCSGIIPVETIEEARNLAKNFEKGEVLLAGERFCLKPEGFDLGNSPKDYEPEKIKGKTIIFSTTNGTRALKLAKEAKYITTAAFVNATACTDNVYEMQNDVLILCAGRSNKTTREDTCCAGLLVELLIKRCQENKQNYELSDAADIALRFFNHYKSDIEPMLESSEAGRNLIEVNLREDIKDCSLIDLLSVVTEYKDGYIKLKS